MAGHRMVARAALAALGGRRGEHLRVEVSCACSHRVAAIYDTSAGPVYVAVTGPHAHGARDFVDTAHHGGRRGREYVDLLRTPAADDALPAWCECGPRTVSRAAVLAALTAGQRRLRVE